MPVVARARSSGRWSILTPPASQLLSSARDIGRCEVPLVLLTAPLLSLGVPETVPMLRSSLAPANCLLQRAPALAGAQIVAQEREIEGNAYNSIAPAL